MNWTDFFNMGGYALYVWGSYLLAVIILGLNVWLPLKHYREQRRKLKQANETTS